MIEEVTTRTIICKNCKSPEIVKFGTYKGVQRYWCKACNRKFKDDDTQFHEKKPTQYISFAVSAYFRGMSFSDIREQLKQEYGYYPSKSVLFKWVNKYTDLARKQFQNDIPEVGNTWIADETMLDLDRQCKIWFYDIIDEKTRFLLASKVALTRTTTNAQSVMEQAGKRAGKVPDTVITDSNNSYMGGIHKAFNGNAIHIMSYPTAKENDTQRIERFHETLKDRTKVFKAFRNAETLIQFTDGWLVYYNYFKPHESLDGKTPAEEAKINYTIKNWADLASVPVSKEPATKAIRPKSGIDVSKALKRVRGKTDRGSVHLSVADRQARVIHKTAHWVAPHKTRKGGGLTRRSDR